MPVRNALAALFREQAAPCAHVDLVTQWHEIRLTAWSVPLVLSRLRLDLMLAHLAPKASFLWQSLQILVKLVRHVQRTAFQRPRVPASPIALAMLVTPL